MVDKIFINEDLSNANHNLLRTVFYYQKKFFLNLTWTSGCKIPVKQLMMPYKSSNQLSTCEKSSMHYLHVKIFRFALDIFEHLILLLQMPQLKVLHSFLPGM